MGYLKTIPIDELTLPSNPEFKVRMRARASYGISKAAQSAMIQMDGSLDHSGRAVTKAEWGAYINVLLLGLIVDWNLTDADENPLPLTTENIDRLDPADGQFLAEEANKRNQLRGVSGEGPFEKPSS